MRESVGQMFAELERRNIWLALEAGPLTPLGGCGEGIEGFQGPGTIVTVRRIKALGGKLRYIALDEPFYFGGLYSGPGACGWSAQEVAANAAPTLEALRKEFPGVIIGDIEPVPPPAAPAQWLDGYHDWLDAYRAAVGSDLDFFHADVAWQWGLWKDGVAALRQHLGRRGIAFGMIYFGDDTDQSDAEWLDRAAERFAEHEIGAGYSPDHVIFQSWHVYPKRLLPETRRDTFTNLINRYFRTRMRLTLARDQRYVAGKLTDAVGSALPGLPVTLTAEALEGAGVAGEYSLAGTVPPEATSALVGVRVNLECFGCSASSDLLLYGFQYGSGAASITRDFANGLQGWAFVGTSTMRVEETDRPPGRGLRITAQPGQTALLNSAGFAVTPGASYTLKISARVTPRSVNSGYFTMIFLAEKEVSRRILALRPAAIRLGASSTSPDGSFRFDVPDFGETATLLKAAYAGDDKHWPAAATAYSKDLPVITPAGILNGASLLPGPVAPGEIVTFLGSGLGPASPVGARITGGQLDTVLADTKVVFDGLAAPLIYVSAGQLSAVVPYGLAGKAVTQLLVEYRGVKSPLALTLPVAPTAPALFTVDSSGRGPAAALDEDSRLVSAGNPAAQGSIVTLFGTGEGQTVPSGVNGKLAVSPLPRPVLPVSVRIGGKEADILYAGGAPGLVAGVLQINARVPEGVSPGPDVPITLAIARDTSPPGVTIAIR